VEVEFRRTGARRYALTIHRTGLPPLEIGGPGHDPLMPHDLQHFIVESELGLRHGIFGFLAAGGQAAGAAGPGEDLRAAARRRRKASRRDDTLLRHGGRGDGAASERATYVCWYAWLRQSADPERSRRAATMAETASLILGQMARDERQRFTDELFARVCARMDALSARWAQLRVGDSLSVEWALPAPRRWRRAPPGTSRPSASR
jgi:hypothetical protein